eukprot:10421587-Lingulodinium_polyedra.AAC.1
MPAALRLVAGQNGFEIAELQSLKCLQAQLQHVLQAAGVPPSQVGAEFVEAENRIVVPVTAV